MVFDGNEIFVQQIKIKEKRIIFLTKSGLYFENCGKIKL